MLAKERKVSGFGSAAGLEREVVDEGIRVRCWFLLRILEGALVSGDDKVSSTPKEWLLLLLKGVFDVSFILPDDGGKLFELWSPSGEAAIRKVKAGKSRRSTPTDRYVNGVIIDCEVQQYNNQGNLLQYCNTTQH